jgi:hypothetical protein
MPRVGIGDREIPSAVVGREKQRDAVMALGYVILSPRQQQDVVRDVR